MYNKSEIMTNANKFRKEGLSKSDALKKAWCIAKIQKLEGDKFMLNMQDHWSHEDHDWNDQLTVQIRELNAQMPMTVAEIEAERQRKEEQRARDKEWLKEHSKGWLYVQEQEMSFVEMLESHGCIAADPAEALDPYLPF